MVHKKSHFINYLGQNAGQRYSKYRHKISVHVCVYSEKSLKSVEKNDLKDVISLVSAFRLFLRKTLSYLVNI